MIPRITRSILSLLVVGCLAACGSGGPTADQRSDTLPPPMDVDDPQPTHDPKRVLVRPAPDESIDAIVDDLGGSVVRSVRGTEFFLVTLPNDTSVAQFLATLQGDARVLEGEPDRLVSAPEGGAGTIPVGGDLFDFSVVPNQPELQRIGAPIARTRATGAGVRVAVIDSGVVEAHVALFGHIEPGGWDFVGNDDDPTEEMNGLDDDGDGLIDEGFGHGTFVSSLILAVAPEVTILPYRVLNSDSTGLASDVAEAITRATDAGVHVINLSLGMEHRDAVVGQAMDYARVRGVMVVASSGNTGDEEVTYPATIAIAASVTSIDANDMKAAFASYGPDVDIAAPGDRLFGAYPLTENGAVEWGGTSFSAALVTGGFALVHELWPTESPGAVFHQLRSTSDPSLFAMNPGFEGALGAGRLDLDAATASIP